MKNLFYRRDFRCNFIIFKTRRKFRTCKYYKLNFNNWNIIKTSLGILFLRWIMQGPIILFRWSTNNVSSAIISIQDNFLSNLTPRFSHRYRTNATRWFWLFKLKKKIINRIWMIVVSRPNNAYLFFVYLAGCPCVRCPRRKKEIRLCRRRKISFHVSDLFSISTRLFKTRPTTACRLAINTKQYYKLEIVTQKI